MSHGTKQTVYTCSRTEKPAGDERTIVYQWFINEYEVVMFSTEGKNGKWSEPRAASNVLKQILMDADNEKVPDDQVKISMEAYL